jgi:hypothetical protein
MEIDCPRPTFTNPLKRLKRGTDKIQTTLKGDADPNVVELILDVMKMRWAEMYKHIDTRGEAVWKQYWGIWGMIDGEPSS